MPLNKPGDPGGQVRRWVNRSLLFAESGINGYELPLRAEGFDGDDFATFRAGMTDFLSGRHLNDTSFVVCLELLGTLLAWFDANHLAANSADHETTSFLYECMMDGQITAHAANHVASPYAAVSGF